MFGVESGDHSVVHAFHIGLAFLALSQLNSEDVASLREESDLFLVLDLLPPGLLPGLGHRMVQSLTPLTGLQDACERLVGKGQVGTAQVG